MSAFDPTMPVVTRDGSKARIICTDRKSTRPIIALIEDERGHEYSQTYLPSGRISDNDTDFDDLINT